MLGHNELLRYQRQLKLREIGYEGQTKLKNAKVAIVGAGGLAHPACSYLAAAGVGTLCIFDHDTVCVSNLQRQFLFEAQQRGTKKALRIRDALLKINPEINVKAIPKKIEPTNAESLLSGHDIILDCTDNFRSRYLLSYISLALNVTLIHGTIHHTGNITLEPDVAQSELRSFNFPIILFFKVTKAFNFRVPV